MPAAHEDLLAAFQVSEGTYEDQMCAWRACWCVPACARSSNPRELYVSDANLRRSMLTTAATSTRSSSPRSSLRKAKHSRRSCKFSFLLKNERAFQNLFSLGGDARVLQRCPRPGDQVGSLQRVCSLPLRRRQLLNDISHQSQTVFK